MSDIVIDANVWAMADRLISEELPIEEEQCVRACRDWLKQFVDGDNRLVVDWEYGIISEYRRNIRANGFAEQLLNKLESESRVRFAGVMLDVDNNNHAILPEGFAVDDPSDRKFVAAAVKVFPYAPIYNAADTDWAKEREHLASLGLTIHELCPDYIAQLLAEA